MKISKVFGSILASLSLLTFAVLPISSVVQTQTAQALNSNYASSYDFPEGTIFPSEGVVFVYSGNDPITFPWVFNDNSSDPTLSTRGLKNGTEWRTDEFRIYNHTKYWRISTNEWIKSNGYCFLEGDGE